MKGSWASRLRSFGVWSSFTFYLKANKVSKSEGTRKLNTRIITESVMMLSTKKIIMKISSSLSILHFVTVGPFLDIV